MYKFLLVSVILLGWLYPCISFSQEEKKIVKNDIALQGSTFLLGFNWGSINYSRTIRTLKRCKLNLSIGYGLFKTSIDGDVYKLIPIRLGLITGKNNHHFEANAGAAPFENPSNSFWPIVNI